MTVPSPEATVTVSDQVTAFLIDFACVDLTSVEGYVFLGERWRTKVVRKKASS
jgi:hypothetical protein